MFNRTKSPPYQQCDCCTPEDKHKHSVNMETKPILESRNKSRRSNVARIMRRSNRAQKRQQKRKFYRMVRKCRAVQAPQHCTDDGAQDGTAKNTFVSQTISKIDQIRKLSIESINCRGINHISALEKMVQMMRRHKLDILFLQETHINTNTQQTHDEYCFVFSTSVTDKQREDAAKIREDPASGRGFGKGKRKNKGKNKNALELYNLDAEKLGSAAVYHKSLDVAKVDIEQHDSRHIAIWLRRNGGHLNKPELMLHIREDHPAKSLNTIGCYMQLQIITEDTIHTS